MLDKIYPVSRTSCALVETVSQTQKTGKMVPQLTSVSNQAASPALAASSVLPEETPVDTLYQAAKQKLAEKLPLYKEYLCYGSNFEDTDKLLKALSATLAHTPQAEQLNVQLPALNYLSRKLQQWDENTTLTPAQRAALTQRKEVIQRLVSAFCRLPDLLLKTDWQEHFAATRAARQGLKDTLEESTLRRLLNGKCNGQEELKAQVRQLLDACPQPVALKERLEYFYATGLMKLQQPVRDELKEQIRTLNDVVKATRHLIAWSDPGEDTRFVSAPGELATALERIAQELEKRLVVMCSAEHEIKKPVRNRDQWLSHDGIRLSVPGKKLAHAAQRLSQKMLPVDKLKSLNISLPSTSFMKLSREEKEHCLRLKKIASPVRANAALLQQAAGRLKKTIHQAIGENIRALPGSHSAETALYAELLALTEDNAQTRLMSAIQAAHTLASQVLSTSALLHAPAEKNSFPNLVAELSGTLTSVAASLRDSALHAQHNFRQQSVISALNNVEKTAGDICGLLDNGLTAATGVSSHEGHVWLDKLQLDIRNNWQGITGLLSKGSRRYPVIKDNTRQSAQEKALYSDIHQAVLPLLNETEKLRLACRQLEMTAGKRGVSDDASRDQAAEKCRSIDLAYIQKAGEAVIRRLGKQDIAVYQKGDEYVGNSVTLGKIVSRLAMNLVKAGDTLQQASWYAVWAPGNDELKLALSEVRGELESIKKGFKDVVEAATGTRLHNNPPEGMIAKDAGEWLASLKQQGAEQSMIEDITRQLARKFATDDDPAGKLFHQRVALAIRDTELEQLPWPLTAEEHLAGTKTQKDYTLAWAEKRLTYGLLYNVLIHGSPAGMLSLYKKTFVSPLRLLNLFLTPLRMELTQRNIKKVKPGETRPVAQLEEYRAREIYQMAFRLVSMVMPQLPKTLVALGIAGYGLAEGGEYRDAFLQRAVSRLPADLFWVSGFALWRQAASVIGGNVHAGQTAISHERKQLAELAQVATYPAALALQGATHEEKAPSSAKPVAGSRRIPRSVVLDDLRLAAQNNAYVTASLSAIDNEELPEKIYSREEIEKLIIKVANNYNYVDSASNIINYKYIDERVAASAFSADGAVNNNFLMTQGEFKSFFKDKLLQVVCQHDVDNAFHDYIDNLLQKVLSQKEVEYKRGEETYIKLPTAIFYMYNSMLNHVRNFDKYSYFGNFETDEILKFTRLKNSLKISSEWVKDHYQQDIVKEFDKIDDVIYHTTGINEAEQRKLLDYLTQPALDKTSGLYKKIAKDITDNHNQYDTQHIISGVYNKTLDEIKKVINLPLPFMNEESETGKYINTLTQVLKNAQNMFGGLYYFDREDSVNTSLADSVRSKILTTYDALDKAGGSSGYSDEVEKFASNNTLADDKNKLAKKYRALINKQLDNYLRTLSDKDFIKKQTSVNNSNTAFIAELQRLVAKKNSRYSNKNEQLYVTLDKFCKGKLSKQDFNLQRSDIVKFFTDKTLKSFMNDSNLRSDWSLSLLTKLSGIDFTKINNNTEQALLHNGEFARLKKHSLGKYNNETIKYLEYGVKLLSLKNPDEKEKIIIKALTESPGTPLNVDDIKDEKDIILHEDFNLALDFVSKTLRADDDIKTFTESVISEKITKLEKQKKLVESQLYKSGVSQIDFDVNNLRLKKINISLLNLKLELKERFEVINYIDEIIEKCQKVNNKYVSLCLPEEQSADGVKNIEDVKIAAIKHFYNLKGALTTEKKQEYLNIFNAHIAGETADAYHLKNLASLYWVIFYHPSFTDITQDVLPWFGKDKSSGKRKDFSDIVNNESNSLRLKALVSYASISRLNTLLARYTDIYQQKEAFAEVITSGDNLPGTYFSISDIKKRSEIPGRSLESFAAQFSRYTPADMEADITVITGQRIRKSGVDVRQLSLKPKAVYSFKHIERPCGQPLFVRDRTRQQPRGNDVLIVVMQDNSMLLSAAWGGQSAISWLPPSSQEPGLAKLPAVVKDLAPWALDYQFKNRDKPEQMAKWRNAVSNGMSLFYQLDGELNYSFNNSTLSSDYLVLDANELNIPADKDIYSWARKNLILLQKTSVNVADTDTVENIFRQQFKDSLNESLEVMKEVYNDQEDIVGEVINAAPLPLTSVAAAARKLIDGLPLNDADVGLMIADVLGISDYFAKGVNTIRKINLINKTRNAIGALKINKSTLAADAESGLEKAVRGSVSNVISKSSLSAFLPGGKIMKPTAEQLQYDFSDLALSNDGKFLTSASQVPLKKSSAQSASVFKDARDFADKFYYDELRKTLGKKKLGDLGIKSSYSKGKNLFFQGDIEEYIEFVEMHEQANILADGQYRDSHIAYDQKVNNAYVRFSPATQHAYIPLASMLAEGNIIYGYGMPGLRELEKLGAEGGDLFHRAQNMVNGVKSADMLVSKAGLIFDKAFQPGNEALLNNLKADIRNMWAELDEVQVTDILRTISARNKLMIELMDGIKADNFSRLCFFSGSDPNARTVLGRIYPNDSSRTIYVNIGNEYLPAHKLILHETSHYASTEDFIYQNAGVYGAEIPLKDILTAWKGAPDINAFMEVVPRQAIGDFLGLSEEETLGLAHYQAVFEIVQSPKFVPEMLKNNADSFVEIIENLDKKYIVNDENQIVINPYFARTRSAREATTVAKTNEADNKAKQFMLKIVWQMAQA
ncbi:hypothetical protein [Vagococcus sp. WN89Y]|uniref:hypothetical protein n=1 Tax=Vagococcus sp. WN89Y TaxID=3457258 RepID=UPI003FCE20AB